MMVTTEADSSFIAQALEYGADEFLMKPMDAGEPARKVVDAGPGGCPDSEARVDAGQTLDGDEDDGKRSEEFSDCGCR